MIFALAPFFKYHINIMTIKKDATRNKNVCSCLKCHKLILLSN